MAARSKVSVCGRSLAGISGLNYAMSWKSVSSVFCVLSGRGLCDGPIPRPEESYRIFVSRSVDRCTNKPLMFVLCPMTHDIDYPLFDRLSSSGC